MKEMKSKHYRPEEIDIIKKYYEVIGARRTQKELEKAGYLRSWRGVMTQAFKLGLKSPLHQQVNSGGFKKGHVPANKGKKMPKHVYQKAKPTMFKKGNKPANTKKKGDISIRKDSKGRPYKYIKVSDGNWPLLHRYLWKKHHGAIPKGHIVVFKDGDSLNCTIDNLELITKAENVRRNHNPKKVAEKWDNPTDAMVIGRLSISYPEIKEELPNHPELIEAARQNIILNREIKKQENEQ